jgi:gas vesicle protein
MCQVRRGLKMSRGFLKGVILGGLIGAGAAVLLAPRPGEETQALLRERIESFDAEEAKARARGGAMRLMERGKALAEENRSQLERAVAEVVSAMESLQAGGSWESLGSKSEEARARVQERAAELVDRGLAFLEEKEAQLKAVGQGVPQEA